MDNTKLNPMEDAIALLNNVAAIAINMLDADGKPKTGDTLNMAVKGIEAAYLASRATDAPAQGEQMPVAGDPEADFASWMTKRGPLGAGASPERIFFAGHAAGRRSVAASPVAADKPVAQDEPKPIYQYQLEWSANNLWCDTSKDFYDRCHGLGHKTRIVYRAPVAASADKPWHDAVLAECMRIESGYHPDDPAATIKAVIDWHINEASGAPEHVQTLAGNYMKLTCGAADVPVAEVRDGGLSGSAIVPLVLWEKLPDGTKLYAAPVAASADKGYQIALEHIATGSASSPVEEAQSALIASGAWTADQFAASADAAPAGAVAVPVKYEMRMRPMWRAEGEGWTSWEECSEDSHRNYLRLPVYNDWQYESRALFTAAAEVTPAPAAAAGSVPDGYVLVPKEPTIDMIVAGHESEPSYPFTPLEEVEAYEAMSGCQRGHHRTKLCYAAMLAAAPVAAAQSAEGGKESGSVSVKIDGDSLRQGGKDGAA